MTEGLDFRGELEQASDVRCTLAGLEGVFLGNLVAALGSRAVPLLERLAEGAATETEAWAARILLDTVGKDLLLNETSRAFREIGLLDEIAEVKRELDDLGRLREQGE